VYTTWTRRIWPEIRVEEPESEKPDTEDFTPMHPECLSAPEINQRWAQFQEHVKSQLTTLKQMRQERPGKFCAVMSAAFLALAFIGSFVSTLGLVYYISVGILTLPGLAKVLLKYPAVNCFVETVFKPWKSLDEEKESDETDGAANDKVKKVSLQEQKPK
jgi:hypothetical protein